MSWNVTSFPLIYLVVLQQLVKLLIVFVTDSFVYYNYTFFHGTIVSFITFVRFRFLRDIVYSGKITSGKNTDKNVYVL